MKTFLIWIMFYFCCFFIADLILPPMPVIEIRFLEGEENE